MSMSSDESSDLYDVADTVSAAHPDSSTLLQQQKQTRSPSKHSLDDGSDEYDGTGQELDHKRSRTESEVPESASTSRSAISRFSSALWQRIFSHLPPPALGRLMSVNKSIRSCLDGTIPPNISQQGESVKTVDVESLWAQWRIIHMPNMPKPLEGLTERDMWKLIRGFRCEMCKKLDEAPRQTNSHDLWHGGPQMSTTRAIWPFGARYCAECCFRSCEKVLGQSFCAFVCLLSSSLTSSRNFRTPIFCVRLQSLSCLPSHTPSLRTIGTTYPRPSSKTLAHLRKAYTSPSSSRNYTQSRYSADTRK
jgi:hypothetical protein